jgi:hypothetical protein
MPNFFGCYVYQGAELIDGREDDSEEIHDMMLSDIAELVEHWNADEEEFTEEGYDIWSEHIWEQINMIQDNCISEILQSMEQDV